MLPRVSVVLPFYNAQATLDRAIKSIAEQSLIEWELVLINHASTDQSSLIAEEWQQRDRRIRLFVEPRPGLVNALNAGLSQVTAPLVARMDADDVSAPKRLACQYYYLHNHQDIGAIGCRVRYCPTNQPQAGMQAYVDWGNQLLTSEAIQLNRFVESPLVHPSVMFRTSLLAQYGPYRSGPFPEDYELWLRWLGQGVRLAKHPQTLVDWYDTDTRLSRTHPHYHPEAFYRIKTQYLAQWLVRHNPFHPQVVIWGGGRKSRQRVRLLEDQGIQVQAVIDVVARKTTTLPCLFFRDIAPPGHYFILSYVGNRGKRDEVRQFLQQRGYQEGVHFLLVA